MSEQPAPEFSRVIDIADIGPSGLRRSIEASPSECRALARRMKLPAIHSLRAVLQIMPDGKNRYRVTGEVDASIDQECVRTLDIFTSSLSAPVERLYEKPGGGDRKREEALEIEIDPLAEEEPDVIAAGVIDIGELAAETLALSLDPWPKKPGTGYVDYQTDATEEPEEEKPSAFARLKELKERK